MATALLSCAAPILVVALGSSQASACPSGEACRPTGSSIVTLGRAREWAVPVPDPVQPQRTAVSATPAAYSELGRDVPLPNMRDLQPLAIIMAEDIAELPQDAEVATILTDGELGSSAPKADDLLVGASSVPTLHTRVRHDPLVVDTIETAAIAISTTASAGPTVTETAMLAGGGGAGSLQPAPAKGSKSSDFAQYAALPAAKTPDPFLLGGEGGATLQAASASPADAKGDPLALDLPEIGSASKPNGSADQIEGAFKGSAPSSGAIALANGAVEMIDASDFVGNGVAKRFEGAAFADGTTVDLGDSAFLTATASGDEVTFTFAPGAFAARADRHNTLVAGASIDAALAADPTFLDNVPVVATASLADAGPLLSLLSGEAAAQVGVAAFNAASLFETLLRPGGIGAAREIVAVGPNAYTGENPLGATRATDHFADLIDAPEVEIAPHAGTGARAWASVFGGGLDVEAGWSEPFHAGTAGLAVGYETGASIGLVRDLTVGVSAGVSRTQTENVAFENDTTGLHLGAYADGRFASIHGAAAVSYSGLGVEIADRDTRAHVVTASVEAAYEGLRLPIPATVIAPLGKLTYSHARMGGVGALDPEGVLGRAAPVMGDGSANRLVAGLGVRAVRRTGRVALRGEAVYERVLGDVTLGLDGRFRGGPAFVSEVRAPISARDRLNLAAGVDATIGRGTTLNLTAQGTFDGDVISYGGSARISYDF